MLRRLLTVEHHVIAELKMIRHLPFVERVLHVKARRPILALSVGMVVMLCGSTMSVEAHTVANWTGLPHTIIDAGAYFIHGLGAIPAVKYIEPVWIIVMGRGE